MKSIYFLLFSTIKNYVISKSDQVISYLKEWMMVTQKYKWYEDGYAELAF